MHRGVLDRIELNLTGDDAVDAAVEAQIVHGRQEFAAANGQAQILEVEGNVLRLALIAVEHAGRPPLATDRPCSPLAGARTRGRFDLTGLSHGDQLLMENEAGPATPQSAWQPQFGGVIAAPALPRNRRGRSCARPPLPPTLTRTRRRRRSLGQWPRAGEAQPDPASYSDRGNGTQL